MLGPQRGGRSTTILWAQTMPSWHYPCEVLQAQSPASDHKYAWNQCWKIKAHGSMVPQQKNCCDNNSTSTWVRLHDMWGHPPRGPPAIEGVGQPYLGSLEVVLPPTNFRHAIVHVVNLRSPSKVNSSRFIQGSRWKGTQIDDMALLHLPL